MLSVALLSRWHVHANDYARQALANPNIEIRAVWDENKTRGQGWANELNVPFYDNLSDVLADSSIQAVIVATPTSMHKEVMVQAALAGKHIFTEKVLAFTVSDCDEVFGAVDKSAVQFMISLPRLTEPYYLYAQQVLDEGILGTLNTIRCRVAHNGALPFEGHPHGWLPAHFFDPELCGGGALIDLGAHPIYLTNRLAGPAKFVTSRLKSILGNAVDDTSAVLVEYESGALGIIEAGFSSNHCPFTLQLYGTKGTLLIENSVVRIKAESLGTDEWITPELPKGLPMAMEQWVHAIEQGVAPTITRTDARRLTAINQAALLSQKEGRLVDVSSL